MDAINNRWEIEETIFSEPSGNVRGVVTAFVPAPAKGRKRGQVRVAHAYLEVKNAPTVTLEVPKKVGLEDLEVIGKAIFAFHERVTELDAAREEEVNA